MIDDTHHRCLFRLGSQQPRCQVVAEQLTTSGQDVDALDFTAACLDISLGMAGCIIYRIGHVNLCLEHEILSQTVRNGLCCLFLI